MSGHRSDTAIIGYFGERVQAEAGAPAHTMRKQSTIIYIVYIYIILARRPSGLVVNLHTC